MGWYLTGVNSTVVTGMRIRGGEEGLTGAKINMHGQGDNVYFNLIAIMVILGQSRIFFFLGGIRCYFRRQPTNPLLCICFQKSVFQSAVRSSENKVLIGPIRACSMRRCPMRRCPMRWCPMRRCPIRLCRIKKKKPKCWRLCFGVLFVICCYVIIYTMP